MHHHRAPSRRGPISVPLLLASLAALLLVPAVAAAQLRVSVVDWVQGRPEIPHPALNGQTTMLQAIAEGGNCGGNYQYRWDINGDQDYDDAHEQMRNASAAAYAGYFAPLGLDVQLPAAQGDRLYYPKVEVTCGNETASATMPVKVTVDRLCPNYPNNPTVENDNGCVGDDSLGLTKTVHANRAVDRGLWYLFLRFNHRGDDGHGHNVHTCTFANNQNMYGHGHALNAFLRRSHGHGEGRDEDVYYRHVTLCGLNALLSTYNMTGGMWFDDVNNRGINGQSIQYQNGVLGGLGRYGYSTSSWVEPLASFGDPTYVAQAGPNNIHGRTLRDIGQDLADGLIQCMSSDKGWYYHCQNGAGTHSDASTNGWSPEALRLLERKMGVETYQWAKDGQRTWLDRHCGNGNCTYHHGGYKLSGNGLVGYGWVDDEQYNPGGNHGRHVAELQNMVPGAGYWGLYYIYAMTKGLRSFVPEITYLPNGRDWSAMFNEFLIPQQQGDGSWNWAGNWAWQGSVDQNTRTALSVQIIQTWLETQAYARATPQASGPGIDITFDHSWSHVLDPSVHIVAYRWNVFDAPGDDRNGDGQVTGDEIVWEFETDDRDEAFVFQYDDELDWGETITRNVILQVEDDQGRVVNDDANVQIELSLKNHLPVIVGHPDGGDAVYGGYLGTPILLDGRATYDVDSEHAVFPGDGNRPRGVPDRITSLHFDLNLDGDFDDAGEDGALGPVTFIPRAGQAAGDRIAVPIRACDDGQWNGECYDGVTRADCSECAFGAASVLVVENIEAPVIDAGGPYSGAPGDDIELDLSGTRDPEGVLGMTYSYRLIEGDGTLQPTPGYPGGNGDWGPNPIYTPDPDGARVDVIRATVTDYGDLSAESDIEIAVANVPPIIDFFAVSYTGRAPTIQGGVSVVNLGNGRYRASVSAVPDTRYDAWLEYQGHDPYGEPVSATADITGDGAFAGPVAGNRGTVGPQVIAANTNHRATVRLSDGDDTVSAHRDLRSPFADPTLRYFFDVGGDGRYEVAGGGADWVEFQVPPGTDEVRIAGMVRGSGGDPAMFDQVVGLDNRAPVFEQASVVGQNDFDVVVSGSAVDPDGDQITYTVDWGDGSPPTVTQGGISQHSYPDGVYRTYTVTITADDGQGGTSQRQLEVDFPEPPENQAPRFEFARVLDQDGFNAVIAASAADPDGDAITYTFDWGDGTPATQNQGGVAEHDFPAGQFGTYDVTITADDGRGGRVQRVVQVEFEAPPDNRPPVLDSLEIVSRNGFDVTVAAAAVDPDNDPLTYTFDWGDGQAPTVNRGGIAAHRFPDGQFRAYDVTVTVSDGRGGQASDDIAIVFEAPAENRPPVIDQFVEISRDGFSVTVAASALDPDGDPVSYTFEWADGAPDTRNAGGVAVHTFPAGQFRAYDVTVTADDGRGGAVQDTLRVEFEAPAENRPPVIDQFVQIGRDGFEVAVTASAADPDGDPLTYTFVWGDESDDTINVGGVATHTYPAGQFRAWQATVIVTDGRGGEARRDLNIDFPAPAANEAPIIARLDEISRDGFRVAIAASAVDPDGDPLTYVIDWGDGSDPAASPGGVGVHDFPAGAFRAYDVTVTVDDGRGGTAERTLEVDFPEPAANRPPTIDFAREIGRDGFEVVISASATDPDGDPLTYTFEWNDGEDPMQNAGGVGVHTYPAGVFRAYDITVTADDGRGGVAQAEVRVDFPAPAANRPPTIEVAREIGRDGFELVASATAVDPDGDPLTYTFDWGDNSEPTRNAGGLAAHDYPAGQFRAYAITVTVDDGRGGRDSAQIQVDFPAPAANRAPVIEGLREIGRDGFEVVISATAVDPDGDPLVYTFEWGDGDEPGISVGGLAVHSFPRGAFETYTVTVTADDGRGGSAEAQLEVDFPPPAANRPPVIEVARVLGIDGFEAVLTATAVDPDGDDIVYTFEWGDESEPTRNAGGVAAHDFPANVFRPYTVTITADDGQGGADSAEVTVDFPPPAENVPPFFEVARVLSRDGFGVVVTATAVDPNGDDVRYTFDWGDGSPTTTNRAGLAEHSYPEGDYRAYTVTITAEDGNGGSVATEVVIDFPPPDQNRPPVIEVARVLALDGFEATLTASAVDADGDPITYTFDWGDESPATENRAGLATHLFPEGEYAAYTVTVTARDGRGGEASAEVPVEFVAPDQNRPPVFELVRELSRDGFDVTLAASAVDPDGDALTYTFAWGDESPDTVNAGGIAPHAFPAGQFRGYTVTVTADDGRGGQASEELVVEFVAPDQNRPPVIEELRLVRQEGFEVLAVVGAVDPDGDDLTYTFAWNDGAPDTVNRSGLAAHRFPADVYRGYTVEVTVDDGRGGTAEGEAQIAFQAPADNQPPIIRNVSLDMGPRGRAELVIEAVDPENGPLTYFVDWGDAGGELLRLPGGRGSHSYPYRVDAPYALRVVVADDEGLEAEHEVEAQVIDSPTIIREVTARELRPGSWFFDIVADDADSPEGLAYSYDFQNDGVFEVDGADNSEGVWIYDPPGQYTARVAVTDPWSGVTVEDEVTVGEDGDHIVRLPPRIEDVYVEIGPGGQTTVAVDAIDPEGGQLTGEVVWGDVELSEGDPWQPMINLAAQHRYPFPADGEPYQGTVRVTDPSGLTAEMPFFADIVDLPTIMNNLSTLDEGEGNLLARANASDPDTDELLYAFDFDGDGQHDTEWLGEGIGSHVYAMGGSYDMLVDVMDTWSQTVTPFEHPVDIEQWDNRPGGVDAQVQGREGECVRFGVGDESLEVGVDDQGCDGAEPIEQDLWTWDFGDGSQATGRTVHHRYVDDGSYITRVWGGPDDAPLSAKVAVSIGNAPPAFVTEPPELATAGRAYAYDIEVVDPGETDLIQLELVQGPPGMLLAEEGRGEFRLTWDVPPDEVGDVEVELLASDGHKIDGEWVPDGARTTQRYLIRISGDIDPVFVGDMGPDAAPPGLDDFTGSGCACDAADGSPAGLLWSLLALVGLIGLRRRR